MANTIKPGEFGAAIHQELTMYSKRVKDGVDEAGLDSIKKLVKLTKATAPVGARGSFKRRITYKETTDALGSKKYIWGVKAPDYRLTHLLAHGHATKDGEHTKADPFLANALDQVMPEYERRVEEVIKNGK